MAVDQRRGLFIIGGVILVAVAAVVAWNPFAGAAAEVGKTAGPDGAPSSSAGMSASEQSLADENEELKRRLAEAEAQASRTAMEPEDAGDPVATDPEEVGGALVEPTFVDDKYGAALAAVDWKVVGTAMKGMVPSMAELAEAILAGDVPLDLAGELQQLNGQLLAQLQPLMDGEVPGTGPNGTFTHPLVVANQVDQVLLAADLPLSDDQSERLQEIANHYLAQDENLRVSAEGYDLTLETLLEETAMKAQFRQEVEQILSSEQHDMLYPDAVQDYNALDLFGTGLVWAQVARPAVVEGPEDLARKNFSRFSDGLKLTEDQQQRLRPLLDGWSRSYPAEYWADKANALEARGNLRTSRTRVAAERQLALFQSMLTDLGLTPEQRQKLLQNNGVMVPIVR